MDNELSCIRRIFNRALSAMVAIEGRQPDIAFRIMDFENAIAEYQALAGTLEWEKE